MPDTTIAVVGASSFVGRRLLARLKDDGVGTVSVVRGLRELVGANGDEPVLDASAIGPQDRFDVVVNLAYPSSGPAHSHPRQNEAIFRTVEQLVSDGGRIIQVSTQAVFGSALQRAPTLGPVEPVREQPYVEAKIAAERHLAALQERRGLSLDIVRLGNVWGAASSPWGVALVQRLLTGRPVGIKDHDGFSNTTDIANTVSYLAFLATRPDAPRAIRFHHLAEFSSVRWSEWVVPTAERMGVEPIFADSATLKAPPSAYRPRAVYRALADGAVSGSWVRSALRQMPDSLRERARGMQTVAASPDAVSASERLYLTTMSAQREFATEVDPSWQPLVDKHASLDAFLGWVAGPATPPEADPL